MSRKPLAVACHVQQTVMVLTLSILALFVTTLPTLAQLPTDILFQNQTTGQIVSWRLNGVSFAGLTYLPNSGSPNWKLVGTGDFNGDSAPDLLYQNQQTGQLVLWYMNSRTFVQWNFINPSLPGPLDWKVVAVADFNGNRRVDILFQNQTTGQLVYWHMNGAALVNYSFLPNLPSAKWKVVGTGDFNHDGKADLLFQNQDTGQLAYWIMNGSSVTGSGLINPDIPGPIAWKVVGVGDLDNDGNPDLLFQNQTTGQMLYWIMDGTIVRSIGYISPDNPGSSDWKAVALWVPRPLIL